MVQRDMIAKGLRGLLASELRCLACLAFGDLEDLPSETWHGTSWWFGDRGYSEVSGLVRRIVNHYSQQDFTILLRLQLTLSTMLQILHVPTGAASILCHIEPALDSVR